MDTLMSELIKKRICAPRQTATLGGASVMLAALITFVGTMPLASQREHSDIWNAVPERAMVQPSAARHILVFSSAEGFVHESIGAVEIALKYMGEKTGAFEVTVSTDMDAFDAANLAQYDAVLFNNTTQLTFDDPDHRRALLEFVRGGKGVIGIHAATDNFYNWPEAAAMMGGLFDGHPWHAGGTWAIKIDEPEHPLNRSFAGQAFLINDEIYQMMGPYSRDTHRVLLSLDMSNMRNHEVEGIKRDDEDFAISWIKPFGAGRVFYCSLGHNLEVLRNEAVLAHYLAGIQYALGDLEVDDAPTNSLANTPQPALTTDSGAVEDPFAAIVRQDFGSSRLSQATIEDAIRNTASADYAAIEERLIEILEHPASTYAAKQFVCRMLRRIGSDRSLPYLAVMLSDEQLTDDARFALQGMESPEVDRILRASLDQLSGPALIGVIGSIGQRRDRAAIPQILELIDTSDTELTSAIIVSLGQIGGAEARDELIALVLPTGLEPLRQDALLRCADDLALEGEQADARDIYTQMTADALPVPVRVAAWRGLVRIEQAEAVPSLLTLLKSDELELQRAGARFMIELQDVVDLMRVAEELGSFTESTQVLAISALGSAGVSGATSIVTDLVEHDTGAVRTAAIAALGDMGDASHVPLLAAIAAEQPDSVQARVSLVRLQGMGVDERIVTAVSEYEDVSRAVLIDVLASRDAVAAVPTFTAYAEDRNESVRAASINALSRLAEDDRLPELIALLERSETEQDRLALEEAIVVVSKRMVDREIGFTQLLEALGRGSEPNRVSFARILGLWPDASPLDTLLGLAGSTAAAGERAAAIAGVLNLMKLPHERTSSHDERLFQSLLELAESNQEKELVLDGLAGRNDVWILAMVEPFLTDPELGKKAEAVRADLIEAVARTVSHDGVGRPVTLVVLPPPQFNAGGEALTDDRWGSTDFSDGRWLGFEGENLDAVIDLGNMTEIKSIRAGFLEVNGSWIFLPREVTFSIAGEDRVFETVATFTLPVPEERQPNATRSVSTELSGKTARYVRVVAKNIGTLPAWHPGAGGLAWLFADEIQINAHLDKR
jgi:type 1 glutamine amidotransferase/HEAT repeat protein